MSGNSLSWLVRGITLLLVLFFIQVEGNVPLVSSTGLAVTLLALGIPHGAADHLIFRSVRPGVRDRFQLTFTAYYLVLILSYGLLWHFFPVPAFLLFIGLSIYHFGQSYEGHGPVEALVWGAFVLLFPILLHFDQAEPIISHMVGHSLSLPPAVTTGACLVLLTVNFALPFFGPRAGAFPRRESGYRWLDLVLLTSLYLATDLLLGFAIYFLFWHSLPAARLQWKYLSKKQLSRNLTAYLLQLLPLTLGAFASLLLVYIYLVRMDGRSLDLGVLFILISLITLPHAFLVDRVYRR